MDNVDNKESPYTSSMATLPVLIVDHEVSSPGLTLVPRDITLGVSGFVNLKLDIIDDSTGRVQAVNLRYPTQNMLDKTRLFSGLFTHKSLPLTSSDSPRIRITKSDDKYLALSSAILTVGNTK